MPIHKKNNNSFYLDVHEYPRIYISYTISRPNFYIDSINFITSSNKVNPPPKEAASFTKKLIEYFLERKTFTEIEPYLNWTSISSFAKKVYFSLALEVNKGFVISYSKLGELAGKPGSARAVGQIMGKNPFPLLIPCHRVLPKNGSLGGFMQNNPNGPKIKENLLEIEGISFKNGVLSDKNLLLA